MLALLIVLITLKVAQSDNELEAYEPTDAGEFTTFCQTSSPADVRTEESAAA